MLTYLLTESEDGMSFKDFLVDMFLAGFCFPGVLLVLAMAFGYGFALS